MTAQDLKNSILQLAVQGKLVPQNDSDEPASELLKRIKAKKEKLIKESKIKKAKPLPPISEDIVPFEIPQNWIWCNLTDVVYLVGNKENQILSSEVKETGKIPVVSQGKKLIDGYCNQVDKCINDIPLIMFGDHTRNVKFIDFQFVIGADGTKFIKPIIVEPRYLYYWTLFNAELLRNRGYARHFALLKGQPFALPPLEEQKRIVDKLEELMPYIEEYGKAEEDLSALNDEFPEKLRKSILQLAVQGKLVPQNDSDEPASELLKRIKTEKEKPLPPIAEDEIPFEIPSTWAWCRLCLLGKINGGFAFKSENYVGKENGIRVLRISDFDENGFNNSRAVYHPYNISLEQFRLNKNDIIVCMTGGTVGKAFFVNHLPEPMLVNQRVADICIDERINPKYIYYTILAPYIQRIINENKNSTNDNISIGLINSFLIPLPPLAEQARIVARVEELLTICKQL